MEFSNSIEGFKSYFKKGVVTFGNFDGLHRGHRELIKHVIAQAKSLKKPCVLVSFNPHPYHFFNPKSLFFKISEKENRRKKLESLGVDFWLDQTFDKEFSLKTPDDFIKDYIVKHFNPHSVCVGYNFHFGKDKKGDPSYLLKKGSDFFNVDVFKEFLFEGETCSSSQVRSLIEKGDFEKVSFFLGDFFSRTFKVLEQSQELKNIQVFKKEEENNNKENNNKENKKEENSKEEIYKISAVTQSYFKCPFGFYLCQLKTKNNKVKKVLLEVLKNHPHPVTLYSLDQWDEMSFELAFLKKISPDFFDPKKRNIKNILV